MDSRERHQLLVTLPNGQELPLKSYIKLLQGNVTKAPDAEPSIDSGLSEQTETETEASTSQETLKPAESSEAAPSTTVANPYETLQTTQATKTEQQDPEPAEPTCQNCLKLKVKKRSDLDPKNCKIKTRKPIYTPIRTPQEEKVYQERIKRLRAKIAEREYEDMTKNIT